MMRSTSRHLRARDQARTRAQTPTGSRWPLWTVGCLVLLLATMSGETRPATLHDLVFLTREGCVNTPDMVNNLDDALKALDWPRNDYQYVHLENLKKTDPRIGYPTPTLLWKGKDIFGMPVPQPPFPEPS